MNRYNLTVSNLFTSDVDLCISTPSFSFAPLLFLLLVVIIIIITFFPLTLTQTPLVGLSDSPDILFRTRVDTFTLCMREKKKKTKNILSTRCACLTNNRIYTG